MCKGSKSTVDKHRWHPEQSSSVLHVKTCILQLKTLYYSATCERTFLKLLETVLICFHISGCSCQTRFQLWMVSWKFEMSISGR